MEYINDFLAHKIFTFGNYEFTASGLIQLVATYIIVLLASIFVNRFFLKRVKIIHELPADKKRVFAKLLTYTIHILGLWFALYSIGLHPNTPILALDKNNTIDISDLIKVALIYVLARLLIWLIEKVFIRTSLFSKSEEGKLFAIVQISKYIVVILAFSFALSTVGIDLGLVWAGLAALLVGLGFGVQQTFNDLVSGLILLIEGTVKVGDIIEIESVAVGKVISIGIRVSNVETRDGINIIVPNSRLVVDNVINWSGSEKATRFRVKVGVAYGSDTQLVKEKLLEITKEHAFVVTKPEAPMVLFKNFGDSSLEFELYFWTYEVWDIELIKRKMRFAIDTIFRVNDIVIAFPQRDIHVKIDKQVMREIKESLDK
jgi:small-conductance mechanosensitive channel